MNVMVDEYIDHYNPSTASGPPCYATLLSTALTFPLTGESFFNKGGIFYFKKALRNGTEFAFCEWVPYVVKTNSVFNKLRIYANTSFVFPLSKKSYDFSEALIVPPSKRQKTPKGAEIRYFCTFSYTLLKSGASGMPTPTVV